MVQKYQKKPVVIEAIQFNGLNPTEIKDFVGDKCEIEYIGEEDFGDFVESLHNQFPEVSFAKLSRIAVRVKNWLEKQGKEEYALKSYEIIKQILAVGFMDFLDENKKDGKMCLSNMECEDIDDAFDKQDWNKLARYAQKYLK